MNTSDRTLVHPDTGNMYEFLETAQDTGGKRVTLRLTLKSRGRLVPDHLHLQQDEHFEVESGVMSYMLNGEQGELPAGRGLTLPKGNAHNHFNNSDSVLVVTQTVEPALDFEPLIRTLIGLAIDKKLVNGNVSFLQAMAGVKYLEGTTCLAGVPVGIQKAMASVVAPLGRIMGYRALYKQYCGIER